VDVEVDDDADPQPHSDTVHAERTRRQEHERRVVSRTGPPRRHRTDVEHPLFARRDPDPSWAQPKPGCGTSGGPHPGLPARRAREPCARDVDEERPPSRVPHRDGGGGRALERKPQRARAERDAAVGRGTRDGCRGCSENERYEHGSHLPTTVNVSVAV
jgi:hypothetical protein